jgi:ParB-like chromosome segregation protein Spo0J
VVPVDSLKFADSPRLDGENLEHIRALAGMNAELPPILVHRATMRVIDGMHRLRAAILNHQREIEVRYFDGTDGDAFVAAVTANIGHGLPLSLADREAAAARILDSHPQWSDRAIAEAVGLASTTVARIRGRSAGPDSQPNVRIGRDGRVRPINGAAGRRIAGRLFADRPDASLREIAEMAGISPTTAMDVRERVRRGDDPVPAKQTLAEQKNGSADPGGRSGAATPGRFQRQRRTPDPALALRKLQRDPSLRLTDNGRVLLRLLSARSLNAKEWEGVEAGIPAHCVQLIADLALSCADEWARFAEVLKDKARSELA